MLHREGTLATGLRGRLVAGMLCLGTLGFAVAPSAVAAAPAAGAATATPATATVCMDGHWPAVVQGRPAFGPGSRAGDYIWHDPNGWHLRVTHPGRYGVVFSGTIHANAAIAVTGVALEPADTFTLSADKKTVTYRFVNHGRVDGLDLRTACATRLSIGARMGGIKLPPRRIWLGRHGRHPLQNPSVILRVR